MFLTDAEVPDADRIGEVGQGWTVSMATLMNERVSIGGGAMPREGGMIDGTLRRVVMFPEDGHPDLTVSVADLTGDARDEVIVWDQEQVWIYTQDRPPPSDRVYAPVRNPDYNESNYRTVVSLPRWAPAGPGAAGPRGGRAP